MIVALFIGFVVSFVGSIPIAGPISIAIFSLALAHKNRSAMFVAIGAAIAEAIWAFLAFWGFSTVLERFPMLLPAAKLIGCLILVALGIYLALHTPKSETSATEVVGPRKALLGFSVTILNPTLLITWTAVVSAAHASGFLRVHARDAWCFAIGVSAGVIAWFSTMLAVLHKLHAKLNARTTTALVHGIGVAVALTGLVLVVRTLVQWFA